MKKVVISLVINDGKDQRKVLKAVAGLSKVDSIAIDMKDKKLTVVGDVDPVEIVKKLRKRWHPDLISVGPAKEKEKEKKEDKVDEPVVDLIKLCHNYNAYMTQPQLYYYIPERWYQNLW